MSDAVVIFSFLCSGSIFKQNYFVVLLLFIAMDVHNPMKMLNIGFYFKNRT